MTRLPATTALWLGLAISALLPPAVGADSISLRDRVGRNEVRVFAAAHQIRIHDVLSGSALPDRLTAQGYVRVRRKPEAVGEFFWGLDRFWVFRRAITVPGQRPERARLIEIEVDRSTGRVTGLRFDQEPERDLTRVALEPVLLSEALSGKRARRVWVSLDELPEHLWRSVLAIEDARFFDHGGVDPRSVARALLRNAKAGKVTQGGSTVTQQLIKVRDLTPRRTLGRKVSEAFRALALEAEYDKEEILEAYLNSVYFGHVNGVSVYGVGAASRAYFGKAASRLSLSESALLAAMIQGPNRLHPRRHPERALGRQRLVLDRLEELEWLSADEIGRARRTGLPKLRPADLSPRLLPGMLAWIREDLGELAPRRARDEQGVLVHTTLDAHLQTIAKESVAEGLADLERRSRRLRNGSLAVALVALDASTGDVLAAVGTDPRHPDDFDRVRRARRQPGSSIKPFVVLEALDSCGDGRPLYNSRRVTDQPLTLQLPSGPWSPENPEGGYRGVVDLRTALVDSLNVPIVRVARWCGFEATARRFRAAGIQVPKAPPPSFVLGAVELTPYELASAFTAFVTPGKRQVPRLVKRATTPTGRGLGHTRAKSERVSSAAAAYLVRDLLRESGARALGSSTVEGHEITGKTGTSSNKRDAWFVGSVGPMVIAVWVGLDDGGALGMSGGRAAVPIWRKFAERAVGDQSRMRISRPRTIVERWVDPKTGLITRSSRGGARRELYRRGDEPKKKRILRTTRVERPIT